MFAERKTTHKNNTRAAPCVFWCNWILTQARTNSSQNNVLRAAVPRSGDCSGIRNQILQHEKR